MADEKRKGTEKAAAKDAAGKRGAKKSTPKDAPDAKKAAAKKTPAKEAPEAKGAAKKAAGRRAAPQKEAPKPSKPAPIMVRASSRYVRAAPRKARLVADQVRGLHIDRARALLQFSPRRAAQDIHKLIESAASNAENNHDLIADEMRVAEITVDEGPTLRRFRPRALGRATPINKRTSHIAVALSPEED
jgi:large subunit ribosomal protein L22